MTIRIEVTNPAEHQPSELRAVATFLNNLAEDRESGRIAAVPAYRQAGELAVASHEVPGAPLVAVRQTTTAAAGASKVEQPEADAPVTDAADTSLADKDGVMWDARIHSETKSQNKDGTWRQKRGVDPDLVKQVLAEQQSDDAPPPPVEDEVPTVEDDAPPPPVDEPAPVVSDVKPADVIRFITTNKIDAATVNGLIADLGLSKAADLFAKPQLAGQVLELLQAVAG